MFCPFCGQRMSRLTRFCSLCGRSLQCLWDMEDTTEGPDMLQQCIHYFNEGHSYAVIVDLMSSLHGVHISLRSLKSKLNEAGFYRRKDYSSTNAIIRAIRLELRGPGQLFGYRMMWQVLRQKYNLRVKRDHVMNLLRELNPQGCERRARRRFIRRTYHSMGPNYMWHADGYDKLKPFGLAISGCIDGFSRKVLWLACGPTNNDPAVIAHYFLSCVRNLGVIPMRLRTDCGTENGTMAAIQCTLRHHHNDYHSGASSHMYGSSTNNQRIESWWSIFRKGRWEAFLNVTLIHPFKILTLVLLRDKSILLKNSTLIFYPLFSINLLINVSPCPSGHVCPLIGSVSICGTQCRKVEYRICLKFQNKYKNTDLCQISWLKHIHCKVIKKIELVRTLLSLMVHKG